MTERSERVPQGEGVWDWQISAALGGNPEKRVAEVLAQKFDHYFLKAQDGTRIYTRNDSKDNEIVQELRRAGVHVSGWMFGYNNAPKEEARRALERCADLYGRDYIYNIEKSVEEERGKEVVETFLETFRSEGGRNICLGGSTFSLPSLHPRFPYSALLDPVDGCDYIMPQIYTVPSRFEYLDKTLTYLARSLHELAPFGKPIVPTLRAYKGDGRFDEELITNDAIVFMKEAVALVQAKMIAGWNWWVLQSAITMPRLWEAMREYPNAEATLIEPFSIQEKADALAREILELRELLRGHSSSMQDAIAAGRAALLELESDALTLASYTE